MNTATCEHCKLPVHTDANGYWCGADETSECDADLGGHRVDGSISG